MQRPLQRRLMLLRHAKAVEEGAGGDHARGLNARGQGDAAALGAWLAAQRLWPQQVYCSTATRARQTLDGLGHSLPTILSDKLYLASPTDILGVLRGADDAVREVMVVGHNPGMHGLLALLTGDYADEEDADRLLVKFPTCGLAVLSMSLAHWGELAPKLARLETLRISA